MSFETWDIACESCNKTIDKLDQQTGVFVVGDSEEVCSIKCVEKVLGKDGLRKAEEDYRHDGHSEAYYWTYWEHKEED
jgi:hypothetical protein